MTEEAGTPGRPGRKRMGDIISMMEGLPGIADKAGAVYDTAHQAQAAYSDGGGGADPAPLIAALWRAVEGYRAYSARLAVCVKSLETRLDRRNPQHALPGEAAAPGVREMLAGLDDLMQLLQTASVEASKANKALPDLQGDTVIPPACGSLVSALWHLVARERAVIAWQGDIIYSLLNGKGGKA